jgi:hypothetical protein
LKYPSGSIVTSLLTYHFILVIDRSSPLQKVLDNVGMALGGAPLKSGVTGLERK